MDFKEIKELILTIDKTSIENVEIENKDMVIKITRTMKGDKKNNDVTVKEYGEIKESEVLEEKDNNSEDIYIVKSPIVGVYYSASSPDSHPFINVGEDIKEGQTLCIIEAMKMMNEIESEVSGKVVEILVDNEEMVEYGQPLIKVRR